MGAAPLPHGHFVGRRGLDQGHLQAGRFTFNNLTISFLVKIQSPFLCSEMAQLDHLGHFMQHLKNKMGIFLFQV